MGAVRCAGDEAEQEALKRALDFAKQALAICDEVAADSIAGVRGQHFVDEIELLLIAE